MPTGGSKTAADKTFGGLINDNKQTVFQLSRRQNRSRFAAPLQSSYSDVILEVGEGLKPLKAKDAKMESASQPSGTTLTDVAKVIEAARDVMRPFENDTTWWRGHAKADLRLH